MSDFDPDKIYHELVTAGEDWADKDAAAYLLEKTEKSLLAEIMNEQHGSNAERERIARADPVFKLHVKNMAMAVKEANRAKVKYDSMKTLSELRRTQQSNLRAEMNIR